ncbi:DUF192 domain-containing protein [Sphingobium cloacae]|uniref:DUF192 domain-containing protein n=1 Tax=Sphingobium cloacae TaxID=120107 RepID=A0A1E1F210_9SPHN|nr:DUF192 domain-containing protein [Sphingobium cloacae]BAV64556.1 conserved exported protein of unknown function [Sphingobium cloacae]
MRRPFLLAALLLAACSSHAVPKAGNGSEAAASKSPLLPLVIRTAKGERRFDVEVALTPQDQAQGLMFRKSLAPDSGMLFPMDPPRTASFWMKDTLIPLDMLFIHTDGTIAFIQANAQPYSREPVSAGVPVAAVLELAGGRAAELGISEGDRVHWGHCAAPGTRPDEAWDRLNFCPAS